MKKVLAGILINVLFFLIAPPASNAAVVPGSKCSKVGVKQTYKGKVHTCVKAGKKLAWDKGIATFPKPEINVIPS